MGTEGPRVMGGSWKKLKQFGVQRLGREVRAWDTGGLPACRPQALIN